MFATQEIFDMKGTIKLKVPQLLEARNQSAADLMYGARLAPATAYRLAKGDAEKISFKVLLALCNFFNVGVDDLIEYVPDEDTKQ